jgi:transcriptional regulator with XRE-family HTH domain
MNECIELNPTPQSIYLDGMCVNQSALSRVTGIDQGYLSKVLSGKHVPGLFKAQIIADALGFTLDRFALALKTRQEELQSPSDTQRHESPLVIPKALQRLLDKSKPSKQ